MFQTKQKINLNLPTSYNRCSLQQLRDVAAIMLEMVSHATRLRPFSMEDFKIAVFFQLTNLEIVAPVNPRVPVEEQYYMVRFRADRLKRWFNRLTGRNQPFALYLWQVSGWINKQKDLKTGKETPGMLDWLDGDQIDKFLILPIDYIKQRHSRWFKKRKLFKSPNPMLDGFSWQRYRFAQDYMQSFVDCQNHLLALQRMGKKVSANDLITAVHHIDTTKALFLANLFEAKIRYTDESTGTIRSDWHYQSNQATDNLEYFRNFPDADWQIILLWWSGVMAWLGKTYPKVFKKQPTKQQKSVNLLQLYARTTATIEKYVGMNAEEVEREPYTTILQQMEDIARQNEENERISREMRRKK